MTATEVGAGVSEIAVGQRLQLRITDIAFGGEGVARLGEFVIFVPFVITGEEVEAEITEVKKSFARARLLEVVHPLRSASKHAAHTSAIAAAVSTSTSLTPSSSELSTSRSPTFSSVSVVWKPSSSPSPVPRASTATAIAS